MLKLITLLLTSSMTVMAGATIAPALPKIQEFFAIPADSPEAIKVKLLLTIPALFTAIGGILSGIIIDRLGRKWPLVIAVLVYGIAGCSGLILNDLTPMLIGRAFLGLSVAMITTTSAALIADYFHGPERTRIMGIQAAAMGMGGVLFLLLGGAVATYSWRFPFLIYLLAFIILPLVLQLEEPDRSQSPHFDIAEPDNQSLPVVTIGIVYALTFITMMIFYMVPVQLPFYIQSAGFGGSWEAGVAIAICTLASAGASLLYAQLKANLSFGKVLMCLFFLLASGYGVLSHAPTYEILVLGLILAGSGLGFVLPNMNVWLNAKSPPSLRGKVLGGLTTCIFLGQFCSPLIVQPIAQQVGLQYSYTIGAGVLFFIGLLIASKLVLTSPSVTPKAHLH
ncbi:MFS transporter [filamentous cyanobacterium LEGE 11480]|uniref:MFS-type drug efflux transporter P55 n=1 Tax=Romeriopsis navalis LEGE 11480 TaxID=2777977 RepID=A0A928VIH2_9CYAN|nr:MFS transporter [Romeriopsis navalis]MBE9029211.1 MFS transporter [Romeriopsis navalis LEGE 11480]